MEFDGHAEQHQSVSKKLKFLVRLAVVVLSVAVLIYGLVALGAFWKAWNAWKATDHTLSVSLMTLGLSAISYSVAGVFSGVGLLTLLKLVAPRWLGALDLAPRLKVEFDASPGSGLVVPWKRDLKVKLGTKPSHAALIRLRVRNLTGVSAEAVEVVLEKIVVQNSSLPYVKPANLRWADSYDLGKFNRLEHHRCEHVIGHIPGNTSRFVDFAFIFPPGSPFYESMSKDKSFWCIHPMYQWLPSHEEVEYLVPDEKERVTFEVTVAIYSKNSDVIKPTVVIECCPKDGLKFTSYDRTTLPNVIGGSEGDKPIRVSVL